MTDLAPQKNMSEKDIQSLVDQILKETTLEEKVAMMSGKGFFEAYLEDEGLWGARPYRAGAGCERLNVPALYFTDGPRGVARGQSTCFPVTMARGASWDRDLERRIGEAMSIEIRAQGCNLTGAVCVNLLRHPGWGRAQETYGEDPYHLGEMGAALSEGLQTHNVIATVKHFALNSIENARFKIDVQIDGRALREVYLAHFKRIIDAGCASVMSAYNKMNGEYCGQNRELLTDILRSEWGFEGFVHSDWVKGVYEPYGASAGLDIENPEPIVYGEKLVKAVKEGRIEPQAIDHACRRILTTLYKFLSAEDPLESYDESLVACPAHTALAREAAEKSPVLITNNGALPLKKDAKIAVFGKLADKINTGDNGSSRVRAPYIVTALQGLSSINQAELTLAGDEEDAKAAGEAAKEADAAIVVVGLTADEEGEYIPGDIALDESVTKEQAPKGSFSRGGDREILRLPDEQVALIKSVAKANKKTIVVIIAGSAIVMSEWVDDVSAVLQTFYSGMEGGNALASLIFGDISPSGKLPFTVARDEGDYPFFDKDADEITYDLWHGYSLFERDNITPHFAFGHGLSYASFTYRALKARRVENGVEVTISVKNTGNMKADEIIQLYVGAPGKAIDRQKKLLKGFERVSLEPGETKTIQMTVPYQDLKYWCENTKSWQFEPGDYVIYAGGSSEDEKLLKTEIAL